jgi:hypothetical protein
MNSYGRDQIVSRIFYRYSITFRIKLIRTTSISVELYKYRRYLVCPITSSYTFCSDFLLTNMSCISMELTYDQFSMLINRFIKLRLSRACCYVCRLRPCLIIVYKAEAYPHEAPPLSVGS